MHLSAISSSTSDGQQHMRRDRARFAVPFPSHSSESALDQECHGISMSCSEQLHCRNNGQGPRVLQRQKCCSMDELDLELRATLTKDQSDPYIQDCRSISALQLLHCSGLQGSQFHTPRAGTKDLCAVARTCRQLRTGSSCGAISKAAAHVMALSHLLLFAAKRIRSAARCAFAV